MRSISFSLLLLMLFSCKKENTKSAPTNHYTTLSYKITSNYGIADLTITYPLVANLNVISPQNQNDWVQTSICSNGCGNQLQGHFTAISGHTYDLTGRAYYSTGGDYPTVKTWIYDSLNNLIDTINLGTPDCGQVPAPPRYWCYAIGGIAP